MCDSLSIPLLSEKKSLEKKRIKSNICTIVLSLLIMSLTVIVQSINQLNAENALE